jgi:hypothetical protein
MRTPIVPILKRGLRRRFHQAKDNVRKEESCMAALAGILIEAPEMLQPDHPYHQHREARNMYRKQMGSFKKFGVVRCKVRVTETYVFLGDMEKIYLGPGGKGNHNAFTDMHRRNRVYAALWQFYGGDHASTRKLAERIVAYYRTKFKRRKGRFE